MTPIKHGSVFRHKTKSYNMVFLNSNRIYFGIDIKNILTYSKDIDKKLFKWLNGVNDVIEFSILENGSEDETILKKSIMRCTKEIAYDIIRSFNNIIDISKIQAIGIVSYAIAYKYMAGYDFDCFPGFKYLARITKDKYDARELILMEIDILKKTDWNPCKKTYNRLKYRFTMY